MEFALYDLGAQVQELINNLPKLPVNKLGFASSLINQFSRKGSLTDRQIPYVAELVALAKGEQPTPTNVGDLSGLIALFKAGGAKLKYPKIRLSITGKRVVLSLAGERSKAPGSINIAGEGGWTERDWYGRVSPDGTFTPSRKLTAEFSAELVPVLEQLSTNPIAAVQAYGKLTGNCMFCGLGLSDERSTAAGFGETCAKNWGLHKAWKAAAK